MTGFADQSLANRKVIDYLLAQRRAGTDSEFLLSVLEQYETNGDLSPRQVDAVLESKTREETWAKERAAEDARRPAPAPLPVTKERVEICGEVASAKWKDSEYGGAMKMLVIDDRGFKVWGTIPESLLEIPDSISVTGSRPLSRGDRVRFAAGIEPSKDDDTFGFFSRPTDARPA